MSSARLNDTELRLLQQGKRYNVSASWHADFADTNTILIRGLPQKVNEHDLLILFSQYGVPTNVVLARDSQTGVSKQFGWLTYEDWESTVLAVDNFDGWLMVPGHRLRVDHAYYKEPQQRDNTDGSINQNILWQKAVKKDLLNKDFA
jgi:RNA-binding motif X-linked protein 2